MGTKLFIIWHLTENNLTWFRNKYGLASGTFLEAALEALENPSSLLLKQGNYYLLDPGYIHCVVSSTNAAVAGMTLVHVDFRDKAESVMKWEMDVLKQRCLLSATSIKKNSVKGIEEGLAADRDLWAQLQIE